MKPNCWLMLIVLLTATVAWAQSGPIEPLNQDETAKPQPSNDIVVPDTRPLTGAQQLGLGSAEGKRTFLLTGFRFTQSVDSNAAMRSGETSFGAVFNPGGDIALQRKSARSELALHYNAGGTFYTDSTNLPDGASRNQMFHQFGVTQTFNFRRWSVLLSDALSYSPESTFAYFGSGYGTIPGMSGLGSNIAGLNSNLMPNQSILAGPTSQLANTAVGQLQYSFSARSSLTATGSYGVLYFPDNDLMDGRQYNAMAGYNRILTSRDSIGLLYGYSSYSFEGTGQRMNNHLVQLSYARRLTGRLSLKLAGGPQINAFNTPGLSDQRAYWSADAAAIYRRGRNEFSLNYIHSITGGSGVLMGAETSNLTAGVGRSLSRAWSGSLSFGYARNSGISVNRDYDAEYGTIELRRRLGAYAGLYFNYSIQSQGVGSCGLTCGDNALRHIFGVGFDWHFRPVRLD